MKHHGTLLVLALVIAAICACYESPAVALHEPGVYKGATDPLLARQRSDKQIEVLRERFTQIQTDR
jgi:hypothetical protein